MKLNRSLSLIVALFVLSGPILGKAAEVKMTCQAYLSTVTLAWKTSAAGLEYAINGYKKESRGDALLHFRELAKELADELSMLVKANKEANDLYGDEFSRFARANPLDKERKKIKSQIDDINIRIPQVEFYQKYTAEAIQLLDRSGSNLDYTDIDKRMKFPRVKPMGSGQRPSRSGSTSRRRVRGGSSSGTSDGGFWFFYYLNPGNLFGGGNSYYGGSTSDDSDNSGWFNSGGSSSSSDGFSSGGGDGGGGDGGGGGGGE